MSNEPFVRNLVSRARNITIWQRHILNTSLIITLSVCCVTYILIVRNTDFARSIAITEARSHFYDIQLIRRWNANFAGVFVEKKTEINADSSPDNPDITVSNGAVYKRDPAAMTKGMSDLVQQDGIFTFNVTSLFLINPDNKPDAFETQSLKSFEAGTHETYMFEDHGGKPTLRYMAPLYIEASCLTCHKKHGYSLGDVRGGISIRLDYSRINDFTLKSNALIVGIAAVILAGLLFLLFFFNKQLMLKVNGMNMKLEKMATTDSLTRLYNRRHFSDILASEIARHKAGAGDFSCIMMDIDHFKSINDSHGHMAGDIVLKHVSNTLKQHILRTDIVFRYGGEEFVILAAETPLEEAAKVAEKLRLAIQDERIDIGGGTTLQITASFGVTSAGSFRDKRALESDALLGSVDRALYRAKADGRNKVVTAGFSPA